MTQKNVTVGKTTKLGVYEIRLEGNDIDISPEIMNVIEQELNAFQNKVGVDLIRFEGDEDDN